MTITLQDVKAIFCLRIGGNAVTGVVDNDRWRETVFGFCGHLPLDDDEAKKQK
jgi:hypothetical protein